MNTPYQPQRRDRVALEYDRSRRGTVAEAGPEQSEVRLDGDRSPLVLPNRHLVPVRERASSKREDRR